MISALRIKLRNAAAQWQGFRLSTLLAMEFDDNATTRERRFERRLHARFDSGYWNMFLLLGKMINTAYINYI